MNEIEREIAAEVAYDDWAAEQFASYYGLAIQADGEFVEIDESDARYVDPDPQCRYYRQSYCPDHDYDHVLERRERAIDGGPLTYVTPLDDDFNRRWAEYKNEFAAREREQEERAFEAKMERDRQLGW
jgi:hypothetical protein